MSGSAIEYVLPDFVVFNGSGDGPFHLPVPVPAATCWTVRSTRPSTAST